MLFFIDPMLNTTQGIHWQYLWQNTERNIRVQLPYIAL
jgi:hypothetical protein